MAGVAALAIGGALVGSAVVASAGTPTLTFQPNSNVGSGSNPVLVTASGFSKKATGGMAECSTASGQPTISVSSLAGSTAVPVSCSNGNPQSTNAKGKFTAGFTIISGVTGPPATGTDSSGGQATTDAQNYPCPPTAAQQAAGATCEVEYFDTDGESAGQAIDFNFNSTTTTPPTTVPGCTPASKSVTATNSKTGASATVTVDPATCLVGGMTTMVTATGLAANSEGAILECSNVPNQPGILLAGQFVPVSCSPVSIFSTTASGNVAPADQAFTVLETSPSFEVGGKNSGTEQNSATDTSCTGACTGNLAADAANYPCPPTAAQVTAGDTCTITVGDLGGDAVTVPISFNTGVAPPANGGSTATTAATAASTATASATKASSSSLAFTGAGTGLWIVGVIGVLLMLLGAGTLLVIDAPRRLLAHGARHARSHRGA